MCGVLEGKTVGTEILSVLARGWGLRVEVGGKEHKGTFVGGRMLYILIVAAVLGLYTVVRASNCTLLNLHSIVIMLHIKIRLEFGKKPVPAVPSRPPRSAHGARLVWRHLTPAR